MAISKKSRFEVLKRDEFTCQYCGRKAPEVTLHVDHIIPRAEGGTDDRENLVAACQDCNLGKGKRLLDRSAPVADITELAAKMEQREAELRHYIAAKKARAEAEAEAQATLAREREARDAEFTKVWNRWFDEWGKTDLPRYHTPYKTSVHRYIDAIGADEVIDAIDITGNKFSYISTNAVRYFIGVCRRKEAELDGRVVSCTWCKRRIVLTKEQAASTEDRDTWIHTSCQAERDAPTDDPEEKICSSCGGPCDFYYCDACWAEDVARREEAERELEAEANGERDIEREIQAWDNLAEAVGL